MNARTLLLTVFACTCALVAAPVTAAAQPAGPPAGQPPPGGPPPAGPDAIADKLIPPELIMNHQQELGIDDRQRAAIVKEVQALQSRAIELKWEMQAAIGDLAKILDAPRIDEARALAQSDKVMGIEREMKRAHLATLVRIRNLLSDAQRAKAESLRAAKPQPKP